MDENNSPSLGATTHDRVTELQWAHRHLQTILDALPSMVGYWDHHLINRYANAAYSQWFGVNPSALRGRSMLDLLGPELLARNQRYIDGALRGEAQTFERSIPRPDGGGVRHSLAHYLPDKVDGEVRGFYVLVHDITEITENRLKLDAALRETGALTSTIKSHSIYSVADRAGNILDVNEGFCQISGYSRHELVGQNHRIINAGVHPPSFWTALWQTIASGKVWRGEICNRAKDGSLYWVDSIIAPFLGVDGRIDKYVSIRTDVTASKTLTAELERERQRLDNILRGTHVGTWEWQVPTGEMRVNERWATMLGYRLADLEPVSFQTWQQHTHPDDFARCTALLNQHFQGETDFYECEYRMRHRDGHWVWVQDRGKVSSWAGSQRPDWMHGTHQDITAKRETDAALQRVAAAEAASQAKSEFLANMSHEIRTPLNAIVGLSHLLAEGAVTAEQRPLLNNIQSACRNLLAVINDVLDLAKIEAGALTLECSEFDLPTLLGEITDLAATQAERKHLRFRVERCPESLSHVWGDAHRLRQVLNNLLTNAIKFTERGEVALAVACTLQSTHSAQVRFSVQDTGIGIQASELPRLFEPFTQADASTTRRFGGSGLGLSIVRSLVQAMGGEVSVQSELGRGSEFSVTVPLALHAPHDSLQQPFAIWLTSDDESAGLAAQSCATQLGWQVTAMQSKAQVLEQVLHPAGARPQVWVHLGQGPVHPGLSTVTEPAPAPVLALVHWPDTPNTGDDALPCGMFNAVNEALISNNKDTYTLVTHTRLSALNAQALPGVQVVLVDDSTVNLDVASRILGRHGAVVTAYSQAAQALDQIRQRQNPIDVVIMDVQMPGLDGYEATRRLRRIPGLQLTPVIALTARILPHDREQAAAAGMDDFISKPLDPEATVFAFRHWVQLRRACALAVVPRAGPRAPTVTSSAWLNIEGIDSAAAADRMGSDPALLAKAIRRLWREYEHHRVPAQVAKLDVDARQRLAAHFHKLAGSAGTVGANELEQLAHEAFLALRTGSVDAQSQNIVDRLADALTQFQARTQAWIHAQPEEATAPPVSPSPMPAQALQELQRQLAEQNLAAQSQFKLMASTLRAQMPAAQFEQLRNLIDDYDFASALTLLPRTDGSAT